MLVCLRLDCSLVSGRYAAADETKQCRDLCEAAVAVCAKQAALLHQSQWECVAATLDEAGDGSCVYKREALEGRGGHKNFLQSWRACSSSI